MWSNAFDLNTMATSIPGGATSVTYRDSPAYVRTERTAATAVAHDDHVSPSCSVTATDDATSGPAGAAAITGAAAYPVVTGPRTLFEVETPRARLALTYQHRSRRWTITALDDDLRAAT